jgi:hypothetical protein
MSRHRVGRAGASPGLDHPCGMSADRVGERRIDFALSLPPVHGILGQGPWQNADAVTQGRQDSSAPTRFADMPDWGRVSGLVPEAPPPHRGAPPADQPCSGSTVAVTARHQHDLRTFWTATAEVGCQQVRRRLSDRASRRPAMHGSTVAVTGRHQHDLRHDQRRPQNWLCTEHQAPGAPAPRRNAPIGDPPSTSVTVAVPNWHQHDLRTCRK